MLICRTRENRKDDDEGVRRIDPRNTSLPPYYAHDLDLVTLTHEDPINRNESKLCRKVHLPVTLSLPLTQAWEGGGGGEGIGRGLGVGDKGEGWMGEGRVGRG